MATTEIETLQQSFEKTLQRVWTHRKTSMVRDALLSNDYRSDPNVLELFRSIATLCEKKDDRFFTKLPRGTHLYRARLVHDIGDSQICFRGVEIGEITKGFDENNSREAPLGKSAVGRNNLEGVSYLYVASDPATACAELKALGRNTFSVAEFELVQDIYVVDLVKVKSFSEQEMAEAGYALGKYWTEVMFWFSRPILEESDYKITQIMAEEFRKQGVDGLLYASFFGMGNNYTVFNCGSNWVRFNNSRLIQQMYTNQIYWDYNNKCCLESFPDNEFYQYSESIADTQLQSIKKSWAMSEEKHREEDE